MGFKIGDIEISTNFILAPMAGITNEAFRIICKEYGASFVVGEMVSDKAICFKNKKTIDMVKVNDLEHPVAIQLFGSDLDSMIEGAKFIDKYSNCDIIDINMGCPVNKVIKSGAGSALLKDPDKIYDIVSNIVKNVKKPVTVKIRAGWDLNSINCVEVAKKIEEAGAKAITIHARTRSQLYSGKANLDYIKAVKEAVSIPVIGNGDVVDIESAKKMFEYTGCDAIAIARGALGNPFIFRELNEYFTNGKNIDRPTNEEIFETIKKHYANLLKIKDEHLALLEMRTHISCYIKGMKGSSRIKDFINKQNDINIVFKTLENYLLKNEML